MNPSAADVSMSCPSKVVEQHLDVEMFHVIPNGIATEPVVSLTESARFSVAVLKEDYCKAVNLAVYNAAVVAVRWEVVTGRKFSH